MFDALANMTPQRKQTIERAAAEFAAYLNVIERAIPENPGTTRVQFFTWLWVCGILDLAGAVLRCFAPPLVGPGRLLSRSLLEAYGRLAWALQPNAENEREIRFLALNGAWVSAYEDTYKYCMNNNVPLPASAAANVQAVRASLDAELHRLGLTSVPGLPNARQIMQAVAGPAMYFSFRDFSDAVHPSAGVVNDLADFSQPNAVIGLDVDPKRIASVLEANVQSLRATAECSAAVLRADLADFRRYDQEAQKRFDALLIELQQV